MFFVMVIFFYLTFSKSILNHTLFLYNFLSLCGSNFLIVAAQECHSKIMSHEVLHVESNGDCGICVGVCVAALLVT